MNDSPYQKGPCSGFSQGCRCLDCLWREDAMRRPPDALELRPAAVLLLREIGEHERLAKEK